VPVFLEGVAAGGSSAEGVFAPVVVPPGAVVGAAFGPSVPVEVPMAELGSTRGALCATAIDGPATNERPVAKASAVIKRWDGVAVMDPPDVVSRLSSKSQETGVGKESFSMH